ncbi:MAG: SGNH/GDSL hydrolase family protein [Nitrospiraceae bacterium]
MSQFKRTRKKECVFAILVVMAAVLITAVLLEVTLGLMGYGGEPEAIIRNMMLVDDPVLDWRYIPNSKFRQGKITNQYNSIGFRGGDHAIEKPSGVTRIVMIGDSVAEGYGVEWKDVFASIVQMNLGAGVEVINLGMGGLNTPQEVHILKEVGVRYAPDYVVVNLVLNDCDFFSSMKSGRRHAEQMQAKIAWLGITVSPELKRLLKSSALLYLINQRFADLWGRLAGEERHDYYGELWASQANRTKISTAFEKLEVLGHEHNFRVVVLIWPLVIDYSDYKFREVHQWIAEQAASRRFASLDLLPVFSVQSFRSLQVTSEDYVHPNAKGHMLAAMEFVKWFTHASGSSTPISTTD